MGRDRHDRDRHRRDRRRHVDRSPLPDPPATAIAGDLGALRVRRCSACKAEMIVASESEILYEARRQIVLVFRCPRCAHGDRIYVEPRHAD